MSQQGGGRCLTQSWEMFPFHTKYTLLRCKFMGIDDAEFTISHKIYFPYERFYEFGNNVACPIVRSDPVTQVWGITTKGYPRFLTHWGRVTHICVSKLTSIGSDNGLSPGSHYLKQCWDVVNWTPGNKLRWNFEENSHNSILKNAFENGGLYVSDLMSLMNQSSSCMWL